MIDVEAGNLHASEDAEPHLHVPHLHVVANRLPVQWDRHHGWRRAPGGLVTALDAVVRSRRLSWHGSRATISTADGRELPRWKHGPLHAVPVPPHTARHAVGVVCNAALWPALHGLDDAVRADSDAWPAYLEYNRLFAEHLARDAEDGDVVWVHDYHLLLVPALLGRLAPDLRVGLSLHTPVEAGSMRALPWADELVDALAQAPLIGVQTAGDARGLRDLVGEGPEIVVSPVSVDPDLLRETGQHPTTRLLAERELRRAGGRRIIASVDRLDPTKGVLPRLRAYERGFTEGWLDPDDVSIVQVAQPSRTDVPIYRELRAECEELSAVLRHRWRRSDGFPAVEVAIESFHHREVAALLSVADVCMVTPVRDGMNLVAKEYSLLSAERDGVLVLARGAGAHAELGRGTIAVDGHDPRSVADGLRQALRLAPEERSRLAQERVAAVSAWTARDWAEDFLDRLSRVSGRAAPLRAPADRPCPVRRRPG